MKNLFVSKNEKILCCPIVGKAISELEREGFVGILETRLSENSVSLNDFIECHKGYARERWKSLLSVHQTYLLQSERMAQMVRDSGIAGIDYQPFFSTSTSTTTSMHLPMDLFKHL